MSSPVMLGGSVTSKPAWSNAFGHSATPVFLLHSEVGLIASYTPFVMLAWKEL
jgi:hypothetical protein